MRKFWDGENSPNIYLFGCSWRNTVCMALAGEPNHCPTVTDSFGMIYPLVNVFQPSYILGQIATSFVSKSALY